MPSVKAEVMLSWADQIIEEEMKGKSLKVNIPRYKTEKRVISKSVALRKSWKKYGDCANDKPGINPDNTYFGEEVNMQFIPLEENADGADENALEKLRGLGAIIKCRVCDGGDHWTLSCPFRDTKVKLKPEEKSLPASGGSTADGANKVQKYVPPSMREGENARRGDSMNGQRHDASAIRISNLSPNTSDHDLEELVKPFGPIGKIYLAKEKQTGQCRGFAYIHFKNRQDAHSAIAKLNGYGYDHLILKADWSRPTN